MNTVERIKMICKERNIPISKLESDCKFGNGYIGQLRKGTIPDDRLLIISKYLNLSVDYLITGEDLAVETAYKDLALSKMDDRLKEYALKLSKLPAKEQESILNLIDMMEGKNEE